MNKKDIKLLVGLQCFELGLGTEIRNTRQICLQLAYRSSVLGKSVDEILDEAIKDQYYIFKNDHGYSGEFKDAVMLIAEEEGWD